MTYLKYFIHISTYSFALVTILLSVTLTAQAQTATTSAAEVPSCTISVVPTSITSAQSATLRWDSTEGALFASIDNTIGNIAPDGKMTISPNKTTTYTMHTWNARGEGGYCSTTLVVDKNGYIAPTPAITQPNVQLQTLAIHPAQTKVVLTSVPYTGPAENMMYILFLCALVVTAVYVAKSHRKTIFG